MKPLTITLGILAYYTSILFHYYSTTIPQSVDFSVSQGISVVGVVSGVGLIGLGVFGGGE